MPSLFLPDLGFGLITASILAFGAVGFTMQYGVTAIPNFAFGDQMTVAAYAAWAMNSLLGWNLWVAAAIASLFMGVFSVAMGRFVFRPFVRKRANVLTMLVVTFLFGLILQNLLQMVFSANFQSYSQIQTHTVHVLGMVFTSLQLVILGIAVFCMLVVHAILQYTNTGIAMRAMSDNQSLARTCGINTQRLTDLVWGITGVMSGLAGVVLTLNLGSVSPAAGANYLLVIVAATVLGGIGRPYGAMLGALIVGIVMEISVMLVPAEDKTLIAFVILVIVLLIRPQGILAAVGKG